MVNLSFNYIFLSLTVTCLVQFSLAEKLSKNSFKETICKSLEYKFVVTNPWISYPIIFEPINKGRLTIWTAISTIPTSEFKCFLKENSTYDDEIILKFSNPINKIEWTFFDVNKGVTYNGVSINHIDELKYKLTMNYKQKDSYLDCNTIEKIEKEFDLNENKLLPILHTSCTDCSHLVLELINSQLKELIKSKLDEQIMDNLYWHLSQILTSQNFNSPIDFNDV